MLRKITLIFLITFRLQTQYIYSHLQENIYFSPTTAEKRVEMNMGNIDHLKQYTLWGWYKFRGEVSAISNILTLRNIEPFDSTDSQLGPYPNPNHPICPYTDQELELNPSLLHQPGIKQNPNCYTQQKNIKARGPDYLYINYDLNPIQNNQQTYSVVFLIQSGLAPSGNSDMKIEGFLDIPFKLDVWSFFAISLNYASKQVSLMLHIFDGIPGNKKQKNFTIDYPDFKLKKFGQLIFAGVENNPYFQSTSGFIGNIAYVNIGMFYTDRLESLWINFMDIRSYSYRGLLMDFVFESIQNDSQISSRGENKGSFKISDNHQKLYYIDRNLTGVRFLPGSFSDLGFVDFKFGHDIKSMSFYFQFQYKENLKNFHTLLERGTQDTSGHLKIQLEKNQQNRVIKISIQGNKQLLVWQGKTLFSEGVKYWVQIGISISPALGVNIAYIDSMNTSDFASIGEDFNFDTTAQKIILQSQDNKISSNGYFDLYRFSILNTNSGSFYTSMIQSTVTKEIQTVNQNCDLRISGYFQSFGCQYCHDKVLDLSNYTCVDYCPLDYKNALTQVCIKCQLTKCEDIDTTKFVIEQNSNNEYLLKPTRTLLNESLDFQTMVSVKVGNQEPSANSFKYELEQDLDSKPQVVKLKMDFKKPVVEQTLGIDFVQDPSNPLFDKNRNRLQAQSPTMLLKKICVLDDWKKFFLNILTWIILAILLLSFLTVVFVSIIRKKMADISTLWKQFLTNFLILTIAIFLLFLGINMPCCVEYVLQKLYKILFSWNHLLGKIVENISGDDFKFQTGLLKTELPVQFQQAGIRSPMFHNMGFSFIIHLGIFLVYIIFKIWDLAVKQSNKFVYKTFVFLEFTILICGYLIIQLPLQMYAFLNIKYNYYYQPYFVFSFVLALIYIVLYVLMFIVFFAKLLNKSQYFQNAQNYNKLYFFFAGRKPNKISRIYDLLFSLFLFFLSIILVFLQVSQVAQTILSLSVVFILIIITLICNPFKYTWQFIATMLGLVCLSIEALVFVIISVYDNKNCHDCGGRESVMCFLVLIPLLFLVLSTFGLSTIYSLLMGLAPKKFLNKKKNLNAKFQTFGDQFNLNESQKMNSSRTLINSINQPNQLIHDTSFSGFVNNQSHSISQNNIDNNKLLSNQTILKNQNNKIGNYESSVFKNNTNLKNIDYMQQNDSHNINIQQQEQGFQINDFAKIIEDKNIFQNEGIINPNVMQIDQDHTINRTMMIKQGYNLEQNNTNMNIMNQDESNLTNFYDIIKQNNQSGPQPLKEDTCEQLQSDQNIDDSDEEDSNKKNYLQQQKTFIKNNKQQVNLNQNQDKLDIQTLNYKSFEEVTYKKYEQNTNNIRFPDSGFMKQSDDDHFTNFR